VSIHLFQVNLLRIYSFPAVRKSFPRIFIVPITLIVMSLFLFRCPEASSYLPLPHAWSQSTFCSIVRGLNSGHKYEGEEFMRVLQCTLRQRFHCVMLPFPLPRQELLQSLHKFGIHALPFLLCFESLHHLHCVFVYLRESFIKFERFGRWLLLLNELPRIIQ